MFLFKSKNDSRNDPNKLRFDLLPVRPLEEVVKVLSFGAEKYGPWDWEKGMSWTETFAKTQRHLWEWKKLQTIDPESGLSHLAHAVANLLFLIEYSFSHPELDDRNSLYQLRKLGNHLRLVPQQE